MTPSILPAAPEGSRLATWSTEGHRSEPSHSNIATFVSPDGAYSLSVEVDDPVHGYLIQLFANDRDRDEPIGRTVVDEEELALETAAEMAAGAEDLESLVDRPHLGPERISREDLEESRVDTPEEWADDEDEETWEEALDEAFEKADVDRSKASLTTKSISENEYYYLQWREGDSVVSQYVAPVNPKRDS
ncbi:hypothetical protein DJ68_14675 [Halorubrum sp. C3]|nr:hypothetical protein DJ68_14675 [Halorubrum sp. C3]